MVSCNGVVSNTLDFHTTKCRVKGKEMSDLYKLFKDSDAEFCP